MSKKIGIVLSGCGFKDGTEIHEAVILLHSIVKHGGTPVFMAPDIEQNLVIDHFHNNKVEEKRNVLVESARIARGNIIDISDVRGTDLDALICLGGLGSITNLSDMGLHENVNDMVVELNTQQLIEEMFEAKKPMGFICISPVALAAVALRGKGIKLTIGDDKNLAKIIMELGNTHVDALPTEIVTDEEKKIVSTPAYRSTNNIVEMAEGVEKLVTKTFELLDI